MNEITNIEKRIEIISLYLEEALKEYSSENGHIKKCILDIKDGLYWNEKVTYETILIYLQELYFLILKFFQKNEIEPEKYFTKDSFDFFQNISNEVFVRMIELFTIIEFFHLKHQNKIKYNYYKNKLYRIVQEFDCCPWSKKERLLKFEEVYLTKNEEKETKDFKLEVNEEYKGTIVVTDDELIEGLKNIKDLLNNECE